MYTNCLLATLNARKKIRNAGSDPSDALSMMEWAKTTSAEERVRWKNPSLCIMEKSNKLFITQRPTNISIKIDTTKEVVEDAKQDNYDLEATDVGAFQAMVR